MEKKYIDAGLAITAFYECDADVMADYGPEYGAEWGFSRSAVENVLSAVPAADVVPVVRCKDCFAFDAGEESCSILQTKTGGGFFCAYGQRWE